MNMKIKYPSWHLANNRHMRVAFINEGYTYNSYSGILVKYADDPNRRTSERFDNVMYGLSDQLRNYSDIKLGTYHQQPRINVVIPSPPTHDRHRIRMTYKRGHWVDETLRIAYVLSQFTD